MSKRSIGKRITWLVEHHLGITYTEFAQKLGTSKQLVSRWVNDQNHPPGDKSIKRIAQAGGVSESWLKYGTGPRGVDTPVQDATPYIVALQQISDIINELLDEQKNLVAPEPKGEDEVPTVALTGKGEVMVANTAADAMGLVSGVNFAEHFGEEDRYKLLYALSRITAEIGTIAHYADDGLCWSLQSTDGETIHASAALDLAECDEEEITFAA